MLTEKGAELYGEARVADLLLSYRLTREADGGFTLSVTQSGHGRNEVRVIRDFTRRPDRAQRFFNLLVSGGVTLLHLSDVVDDLLAE